MKADSGAPRQGEIIYFNTNPPCGLRDEEHAVTEWLGEFDLQKRETWFLEWSQFIADASIQIQLLEKKLSPHLMEPIFSAVFTGAYLNYYAGSEFEAQFRANTEKVKQMLESIMMEVEKEGI